ncbi:hypothetical protein JF66_12850 [Cryobacterium sp. MLB-32]|uniref:hypothetical protein n=1 Tax=Cryobacterium sp. MLB-32 TaxID=1529318 RepID=UPI0004E6339C|nr:hypothetical protein [Cryobacterium sp. MLB-32]KFF59223.1 hypothetical protein JF66_12850 [Cryobacterium sp. MLB-32]
MIFHEFVGPEVPEGGLGPLTTGVIASGVMTAVGAIMLVILFVLVVRIYSAVRRLEKNQQLASEDEVRPHV